MIFENTYPIARSGLKGVGPDKDHPYEEIQTLYLSHQAGEGPSPSSPRFPSSLLKAQGRGLSRPPYPPTPYPVRLGQLRMEAKI
jgi:hypothetical protein